MSFRTIKASDIWQEHATRNHDGPSVLSAIVAAEDRAPKRLRPALSRLLASTMMAAFLVFAGDGQAETLSQMLGDVYDNNPDIKAQEAGYEASKASRKKARSALMPQVSATGSHSYSRERLRGGGSNRSRTSQYGIKGSQRLFSGFQNRNNLTKSRYDEHSASHQVRNRERLVLLEAVKAYMDVYAARRMISLRRQHVANMEKQRRATVARIRAGELTRTDLSKTDALLYRARAALEGALADLGSASGRYEALVGYQPGKLALPQLPTRYVPKSAEEAQTKAQGLHPDLRAARARNKASDYAVKSAKGAFLPTVDLSAEHNLNYSSSINESTRGESSFSLRLSLPLFDGGSRLADVDKAKAERKQTRHQTNSLTAQVKADAKENFLRNRAAQSSLRQARAEVKAARDLLRGIRIEEKAGQRSFLDILDAEVSLLDARELEIYSQADSVVAVYSLLASTGQLTVAGSRKAQAQARLQPQYDHMATGSIGSKRKTGASGKRQNAKKIQGRNARDPWSGLR